MNIVYLHCHDVGREIGAYDSSMFTPNLDRFSREAYVFENAHTPSPTCSPSRACLLTGRYAHQNGMIGLAHLGFRLNAPETHLANRLRAFGYHTSLFGIQHETMHPEELGYQEVYRSAKPTFRERDEDCAKAAAAAIRRAKSPFFYSVGMFAPHRPFETKNHGTAVCPQKLPDRGDAISDYEDFDDAVTFMDRCCGMVLDALNDSPRREDTLVMFTTDHGIPFPLYKCTLFDTGTGVSWLLRIPGRKGRRIPAMVSHLDMIPTIFDLCGIPIPPDSEGVSLLPLLDGKTDKAHDEIFGEINFHVCRDPQRSVRTDRYKLIRRFSGSPDCYPMLNTDNGGCKAEMAKEGFYRAPRDEVQLYDLCVDPEETHNLAGDPSRKEALADLDRKLSAWMRRTDDPLLGKGLRVPEGAVVKQNVMQSDAGSELIDMSIFENEMEAEENYEKIVGVLPCNDCVSGFCLRRRE